MSSQARQKVPLPEGQNIIDPIDFGWPDGIGPRDEAVFFALVVADDDFTRERL